MKVYYRRYKHSKVATGFSKVMSFVLIPLLPLTLLCVIDSPITLLVAIPLYLAVVVGSALLEQLLARKFPDKHYPGINVPAFDVSEEDYRRAMHITSLSLWSKELKEIARVMGKTPAQTKKYFEEIVRNYNLAKYGGN